MADRAATVTTISNLTTESYMRRHIGDALWAENIGQLLDAGFGDAEVVWIMDSKLPRWANDCEETVLAQVNRYGAAKIRSWMDA